MRARHVRTAVLAAFLSGAVLVSCGGETRLTISEFTDAANQECASLKEASDEFRKAQDPSFEGEQVATFVHGVADRLRALVENLDDLAPPEEMEPDVDELLGVLSDYADGLDELADATGPGQTFQGVLQENTAIVNRLNGLARAHRARERAQPRVLHPAVLTRDHRHRRVAAVSRSAHPPTRHLPEVQSCAPPCSRVALAMLGVVGGTLVLAGGAASAATPVPPEQTICFDGALARTRTEIDADISVPQFDASLGTLLGVAVTGPSMHLDTDAVFESTAGSAIISPRTWTTRCRSPAPAAWRRPRPSWAASSASPPRRSPRSTARWTSSARVRSRSRRPPATRPRRVVTTADAPVLSAFTGAGTMPFHLTTVISETFMGGGGNVQAQINTFASAAVQVCYRYAPPPPTEVLPDAVEPPAAPSPAAPTLPATGATSLPLAGGGRRCPRPRCRARPPRPSAAADAGRLIPSGRPVEAALCPCRLRGAPSPPGPPLVGVCTRPLPVPTRPCRR